LDGKQRLLSLMQYTGHAEGKNNEFSLSGLEVLDELSRKKYGNLQSTPALQSYYNAFMNHTIRTVLIRNWPNTEYLHVVFLRLNTGSVKLSPQELRQAMVPGPFADFVDDMSIESIALKRLLSRHTPDPRMRDVELVVRALSLQHFIEDYRGRMKSFLDESCEKFNSKWENDESAYRNDFASFESAVDVLLDIFGADALARKPGSKSFNRAVFDSLIFFAFDPEIRALMHENHAAVIAAYRAVLEDSAFLEAVESDTAGIPNTSRRLSIWGKALQSALSTDFNIPALVKDNEGRDRIRFSAHWL
jgi:hypothetical protein